MEARMKAGTRRMAAGDWNFPTDLTCLDVTLFEYDGADQWWPDSRSRAIAAGSADFVSRRI